MVQQLVLFDSSVLINILATGRQQEILAMFQGGAGVCAAVAAETQFLRGEQPTGPKTRVSLDPLLERRLLRQHELRDDEERALYVELAADLDDGEAMTLAIAHQRGAAVATDDRKARRIANQRFGANFPLLRTTGIMHDWVRLEMLEREAVRAVLGRIQTVAQFRPPNDDPLREWWVTAVT